MDAVEQLRQAIHTVNPALLTEQDRLQLVRLLAAIYDARELDGAALNFG